MCGIVGVVSRSGVVDRNWVAAAAASVRHRGPDDAGEWWSDDGRVGLGHRRLAIVDLSSAGHQPMCDLRGEHVIVFNGEIYNFKELRADLALGGHRFRSHSDTEVVLAAYREWGLDCLQHLNGMFAFAIYDAREQRLLLARDRAGEKPLFYSLSDEALRFGSELKAILADAAVSRRIDREALDCYLSMGFVPGDRCILRGVQKLPPAHALSFDLRTGRALMWRYWRLPKLDENAAAHLGTNALVEELEAILSDAVARQLVADVPVGVLLSGGLDSSLVTALAVRHAPKVKTFTVAFSGYRAHDESTYARLVSTHFGTEHTELSATEVTVDVLPTLARQFDEPIVDSSMIPTYLISRLVRERCAVVLGGDGGDELFGGYRHYERLARLQCIGWVVPRWVRRRVAATAESLPIGFKGRNWLQAFGVDLQTGLPLVASYFDAASRIRLMSPEPWSLVAEKIRSERTDDSAGLLQRATRTDFENYLAEDILVKVDRASMLSSLEVRAPLLDVRLIEFAFGKVPSRLKATTFRRKALLRALATRLLPPQFDAHRKHGFSIPLSEWLKEEGSWSDYFREVLVESKSGIFSRAVIDQLLLGQAAGHANSERLFALVLLELWMREYRCGL
jgi:asparagine synthase (glutamine-hydrolysing)